MLAAEWLVTVAALVGCSLGTPPFIAALHLCLCQATLGTLPQLKLKRVQAALETAQHATALRWNALRMKQDLAQSARGTGAASDLCLCWC